MAAAIVLLFQDLGDPLRSDTLGKGLPMDVFNALQLVVRDKELRRSPSNDLLFCLRQITQGRLPQPEIVPQFPVLILPPV